MSFVIRALNPMIVLILLFVWLPATFGLTSSASAAEVSIGIKRERFTKIQIGIMNFSNKTGLEGVGSEAVEILKNDLEMSGLFQIIDLNRIGIRADMQEEPDEKLIRKAGRRSVTFLVWGKVFWKKGTFAVEGRIYDASTGDLISGKRYLGEERILRKMVHKLSDEIVYRYTGEVGIAQSQILYISRFEGRSEVFMMDYDGYNPVRVTGDRSIKVSPSWSSDGRLITYTSYRDGNPDIYNLDITTGNRWKMISFPGLNISSAWSPKEGLLAFSTSKDGNSEIYTVDQNGANLKRLTFNSLSDISPAWSPTGQEITFVSDRGGAPQLYVMDKNGLNVRRLTFKGSYNTSPQWSIKSGLIVYSCMKNGRNKICLISPDRSVAKQITYGPGNDESPSWAPNGRSISFSSSRKGVKQIFTVSSDGTHLKQLTKNNSMNTSPSWSPVAIN